MQNFLILSLFLSITEVLYLTNAQFDFDSGSNAQNIAFKEVIRGLSDNSADQSRSGSCKNENKEENEGAGSEAEGGVKEEYELELKAISDILGMDVNEINDESLKEIKQRLTALIEKIKSNKNQESSEADGQECTDIQEEEKNNGAEKKLLKLAQSALSTINKVRGSGPLKTLKELRRKLETIGDSLTDQINSMLDKVQIGLEGFDFKLDENSFK